MSHVEAKIILTILAQFIPSSDKNLLLSKTVQVSRTASNVTCDGRFVIGRERPGQQSEVAALIQQTLEQERRQRELLEQQYAHYDADDDEVTTALHPCLAAVSPFIDTHSSLSGWKQGKKL